MQKDLTVKDFESIIELVKDWKNDCDKASHESKIYPMSKQDFAKYLKQIFDERRAKKRGILIRKESFWIGLHYSIFNKRYCLNILPCVTIWWVKKGGNEPDKTKM